MKRIILAVALLAVGVWFCTFDGVRPVKAQFNGCPSGFCSIPASVTNPFYTATGPSSGTVGSPSTNFTVALVTGTFTGSQTITIADGSQGGTITPSVGSPGTSTVTVTPTSSTSNFTFTYNAASSGAKTLTFTNAQSWIDPSPLTYTASSGGYAGPGDIVSGATAWWGLRGYNAAFSGNVAQICDHATGIVCANATWSGSTLTLPTIGGIACNNSTNLCDIAELYDQSGSNACSSAPCPLLTVVGGSAIRPSLVLSAIGSLPGIGCGGSAALQTTNTFPTLPQPFTQSIYAKRTSFTSAVATFISSDTGGEVQSGFSATSGEAFIFATTSVANISGVAENAFHAMQLIYNGSSSISYIDGTQTTSLSPGTFGFPSGSFPSICAGSNNSGDVFNPLTGVIGEVGIWSSAFSSGAQSSMNANQTGYY